MNAYKPRKGEAFVTLKKINFKHKDFFYLSKKGDLDEVAKNLYDTLRKIKKNRYKSIAIEKINNYGLGQSINDRLSRASKKK